MINSLEFIIILFYFIFLLLISSAKSALESQSLKTFGERRRALYAGG